MTDNLPEGSAAPSADLALTDARDLELAIVALFEKGDNTVPLASLDRTVTISPAKMWQMKPLMNFFQEVIGRCDGDHLRTLIDSVVAKQQEAIEAGQDPSKLNLRELATSDVVKDAFGHMSLVVSFMHGTFDLLPGFVAMFVDISEEEFGQLDFDEGALLVFGILALNYDFFTRRLLPVFTGYLRSLASENQSAIRDAAQARKQQMKSRK